MTAGDRAARFDLGVACLSDARPKRAIGAKTLWSEALPEKRIARPICIGCRGRKTNRRPAQLRLRGAALYVEKTPNYHTYKLLFLKKCDFLPEKRPKPLPISARQVYDRGDENH